MVTIDKSNIEEIKARLAKDAIRKAILWQTKQGIHATGGSTKSIRSLVARAANRGKKK